MALPWNPTWPNVKTDWTPDDGVTNQDFNNICGAMVIMMDGMDDLAQYVNDTIDEAISTVGQQVEDAIFHNDTHARLLLIEDIYGTSEVPSYDADGAVTQIEHRDQTTRALVRTDVFEFLEHQITEVRTLAVNGQIKAMVHRFDISAGNYIRTDVYDSNPLVNIHGIDANTLLMLNMEGSNLATTTTDESGTPKPITFMGGAKIVTEDFAFGQSSAYLDGVNSYIKTPDHAQFNIGSGNFTLEQRFKLTDLTANGGSYPNYQTILAQWLHGATTGAFHLRYDVTLNALVASLYGGTLKTITSAAGVILPNQWYHVALVRNGNTGTLYLNGKSLGTVDLTGFSLINSALDLTIGADSTGEGRAQGYFDACRISNVARWTNEFIPPVTEYKV